MRAFLYLRRGHGSFSFCCARSLRSCRCPPSRLKLPGAVAAGSPKDLSASRKASGRPAFCFTLPETACQGVPRRSPFLDRPPLAKRKMHRRIFDCPLKAWKRICATGAVLGGSGGGHRHKGSTPNSCIGIGVRHTTAGNASRLFRASVANLPASRAQRQARPHLVECKAFNRHGDPFKILPTKRRSEQGRGWRVFAYGTTPFAHPLHCRPFSIRFNVSPHPVFRKAKEAADAAS